MKVVVSDTSTIGNLIIINRLDLLRKVYGHIIIPPAVQQEILALKKSGRDLVAFDNASWIEMSAPGKNELELMNVYNLDSGEKEALALAQFMKADLLIIDEKAGREIARKLGIKTTGLLGTILEAKKLNSSLSVKEILDELIRTAGFWIGYSLYMEVLMLAGEK